jgi:hypothetical protein
MLWVFENAYPDPDPVRLNVIDEVAGWHLAAFNLSTETLPAQRLITVRDLNETSASRLYGEAYDKLVAGGVNKAIIDNYFSQPVILPIDRFSVKPDPAVLTGYKPVQLAEAVGKNDPNYTLNIKKRPFISWSNSLPGLVYPARAWRHISPQPVDRYAYAGFNVSKQGLAEQIRILDYQSHNGATRKQAYDTLWSMQFRPRLVKGNPVIAKHYLLHYLLPE